MAAVDLAASTSEDEAVGPGGARRRRRHTTVAVCLFFLALVLAMFWPSLVGGKVLSAGDRTWFQSPFISQKPSSLVRPSNKDLADPVEVFHPDTWRARQALADGSAALWNPNVGAGRPLLASQQFSPLFPTQWPAFVLPFKDAWGWIAALKLLVAAFGQYLFCRALGLRAGPSALGGLTFGFSVYMVIWLEHPLTNAWILLPWLFLLTRSVAERARPGAVLGLSALLGALFVAGHPESEAFVVAGLVAYLAFELAAGRHDGRLERGDVPRHAAWWALALGGGALLSAVDDGPRPRALPPQRPGSPWRTGAAVQRPRQLGLPRGLRPPGQGLLRSGPFGNYARGPPTSGRCRCCSPWRGCRGGRSGHRSSSPPSARSLSRSSCPRR